MRTWIKYTGSFLTLGLALTVYISWTPDIPHEDLVAKYASGASDFIELPSGVKAHFRLQGNVEGPTILLLHGSNASLHTWEAWVDALEEDNFLVTVDLPGHGLTGATPTEDYSYQGMVDFVDEFVSALNLERFFLGGNSMGGAVTLSYALAYSEKLYGIVLVDAAGITSPEKTKITVKRPFAFEHAGKWYFDWILENITPRSIVREGLQTSVHDDSLITEALIDQYWHLVLHPGNRRATGLRFAWYRESADLDIDKIVVPTLILWGEEDSLIPVEVGQIMHRRIENSRFISYPNTGHIPMEEIPAISATAVRSFVSEHR